MSLFYFNFRQGPSFSIDDEGCQFTSVEDAYLGAVAAAQDMWRELLIRREDPMICAFDVRDEEGHELFTLPFSEVLDACHGRTATPGPQPVGAAIYVALAHNRAARRTMSNFSIALNDAKASLREAIGLLKQIGDVVDH
jgi:uncharacterized protein DUF6894